MTTFETDVIVETADLTWFWPVFWIAVLCVVALIILASTVNEAWGFAIFGVIFAFMVVTFINVEHREKQTVRTGQLLEYELREAGFSDAEVDYVGNTETGDGTEFKYAKDNDILECELVAGPDKGVFQVVCF